jgi:hypothetical protein
MNYAARNSRIRELGWELSDPYGSKPETIRAIHQALGGKVDLETISEVLDAAAVRAGLCGE